MIPIFNVKCRLRISLLLTCFVIMLLNNMYNFYELKIYGHLFTPDETATFMAVVDQVQIELELIQTNLEKNNASLAQNHAYKAMPLTSRVISEIAEDNQRLAGDLIRALNELQNISSSSKSKQQDVSQLVTDLDERLDQAKIIRLAQMQPSSNFLDKAARFLGQIFGGNSNEVNSDITQNSKIEALAFVELVDAVLINYGKAYAVGFDMTNMSNMVMIDGNNSTSPMVMNNSVTGNNADTDTMNMNMNMHSMNTSDVSVTRQHGEMNGRYSLVDIAAFQSAKALATNALQFFNSDLRGMVVNSNTNFVSNLESGLTRLNDSIANKDSPLHIMTIVHSEIHPNLLEAFDLEIRN